MSMTAQATHYCDAKNINYGETCSRKATKVYDKPGAERIYYCTQHAPKRNRFCKPLTSR